LQGVQSMSLDAQGNLVIQTAGGAVVQQAPVTHQLVNGVKQTVTGRHLLIDAQTFAFPVGADDATKPLLIDPVVSYATYLGGSGDDHAYGMAVDTFGAAYVTGSTNSANFPGTTGTISANGNVFVTKLDPTGTTIVYSTYSLSVPSQMRHLKLHPASARHPSCPGCRCTSIRPSVTAGRHLECAPSGLPHFGRHLWRPKSCAFSPYRKRRGTGHATAAAAGTRASGNACAVALLLNRWRTA
jgi:hypothetical protein